MEILHFDRHDEDGRVILSADDGTRYELDVDDELRGAVRRTATLTSKMLAERGGELRPRDIQALVRAGVESEEVAKIASLDLDHVARYAAPVLDERRYVAARASQISLAPDAKAPTLGEVAADRLVTRGVAAELLEWDAVKESGRWILSLTFPIGEHSAQARWAVDLPGKAVNPLDDEARWITEAEMGVAPSALPGVRRLSAVSTTTESLDLRQAAHLAKQAESENTDGPEDATLTLLDDLSASRGLRQPVETGEPPAAHPAFSALQDFQDAQILDLPELSDSTPAYTQVTFGKKERGNVEESPEHAGDQGSAKDERPADIEPTPTSAVQPGSAHGSTEGAQRLAPAENSSQEPESRGSSASRSKSKRTHVPSWDEIVFGAKPDED